MRHGWLVVGLCLIGATGATPQVAQDDGVVTLDSGVIRGTSSAPAENVRVFKGIPFAAPPVGDRRWRPPHPVASWGGERAADQFGPRCTQSGRPALGSGLPIQPRSEDCLYLNVWTAAEPDEHVLSWFGSTAVH